MLHFGRRTRPYLDQPLQRRTRFSPSEHWWHPLQLSLAQILAATRNLSSSSVIGVGGYSTVYKGHLPDATRPVAVKVLRLDNRGRARRAFKAELETLGKVRHRNLVHILGSCSSSQMLAIVMKYIPNGTLDQYLHGGEADIGWERRFNIILGVSNALAYLHHECPFPIVHCDVKPGNILLDFDLEPHLGDFGTARYVSSGNTASLSSSLRRVGKFFLDAQWHGPKVTTKGDVYSFGVVMLEVLTRRRPTLDFLVDYGSLAKWVLSNYPDQIEEVVDPALLAAASEITRQEIFYVLWIGLLCTRESPSDRPSMQDVVSLLGRIRQSIAAHGTRLPQWGGSAQRTWHFPRR